MSDVKITKNDKIRISCHSELMKNHQAELPVNVNQALRAIIRENGDPVVFSVGDDQCLYVIHSQDKAVTGWNQHNLSSNFGKVTSFDVFQDSTGKFCSAIAVREENRSRFYMSELQDLSKIDFDKLDLQDFWKELPLHDAAAEVNQTVIDHKGALIATKKPGEDALYYTLDTQRGCQKYELPENGAIIHEMALGTCSDLRGVFLLYEVGHKQTLLFQSFPDPKYHKTIKFRFACPGLINSFSLLPAADGNHHLYAAGEGVYLFTGPETDRQTIVEKSDQTTVLKIGSAQHDGLISLWLVQEDKSQHKGLYYVTNNYYLPVVDQFEKKWTSPIQLKQSVGQFTALRSKGIYNHLFLISESKTLSHFWQDEQTTLWKENEIPIHDTGKFKEFDSYTLHVQFDCDDLTKTFNNETISITSSSSVYLSLNGKSYQTGPDKPVEITLDDQASITIINKTQNIHAPCLHINAQFLPETQDIELTQKVNEKLKKIKTGDDLKNAKKHDGSPLLPPDHHYDQKDLDHIASGVQQMLKTADKLKEKKSSSNTFEGSPVGKPHIWSLKFHSDNKILFFQDREAKNHLLDLFGNPDSEITDIKSLRTLSANAVNLGISFGDFFHRLKNEEEKITDFIVHVVTDGIDFFITIGTETYNFILKTVEEIYAALESIFKQAYVFFKDLFEWLAYLFNWDDILLIHNMFKNTVTLAKDKIIKDLETVKGDTKNGFTYIRNKLIPRLKGDKSDEIFKKRLGEYKPAIHKKNPEFEEHMNSPQSNWGTHHLKYNMKYAQSTSKGEVPKKLRSIFTDLGKTEEEALLNAVNELCRNVFNQINDLDFGQIIDQIIDILLELGLNSIENVTLSILVFAEWVIDAIYTFGDAHIDIPIITPFYEEVLMKGKKENKLSFLDLSCLIVAIPATVINKSIGVNVSNEIVNKLINAKTTEEFILTLNEKIPDEYLKNSNVLSNSYASEERSTATFADWFVSITQVGSFVLKFASGICDCIMKSMDLMKVEGKNKTYSILYVTKSLYKILGLSCSVIRLIIKLDVDPPKGHIAKIRISLDTGLSLTTAFDLVKYVFFACMYLDPKFTSTEIKEIKKGAALLISLPQGMVALLLGIGSCVFEGIELAEKHKKEETPAGLKDLDIGQLAFKAGQNISWGVERTSEGLVVICYLIEESAELFPECPAADAIAAIAKGVGVVIDVGGKWGGKVTGIACSGARGFDDLAEIVLYKSSLLDYVNE